MIRFFDILFSFLGLIILLPFFLIISIAIRIDSRGSIFYFQERVGKDFRNFRLIKFRTMVPGSDRKGGLTIGVRDPRVTGAGKFLRRHKLDELPQLVNVLKGDMSLVGPRPELPKYVALYSGEQKKVLAIRPGITDLASLEFINENEILSNSKDPERTYIEDIMPVKLEMNRRYLENPSPGIYFRIIGLTLKKLLR